MCDRGAPSALESNFAYWICAKTNACKHVPMHRPNSQTIADMEQVTSPARPRVQVMSVPPLLVSPPAPTA